jgi:hypothetical protein
MLITRKDKLLSLIKKRTKQVSRAEADKIQRDGAIAEIILEKPEGKPHLEYLQGILRDAEEQILNISLRERRDEGMIDGIKSVFIHTKQEQLQDLQSKYQAFKSVIVKLEEDLRVRDALEKAIENEDVEIVEELDDKN